jgi:lipocalin
MKAAATLMTVLVLTTGMALAEDAPKAPEPAKPVDAASFYAGRWYEIGRTPKSFNAGCVAGGLVSLRPNIGNVLPLPRRLCISGR